ncbi:MAG: hemolysin, partial [Verrucomicrobiales bacterium]|nr:hemolysin [Verrucomicrobiales bacterium]
MTTSNPSIVSESVPYSSSPNARAPIQSPEPIVRNPAASNTPDITPGKESPIKRGPRNFLLAAAALLALTFVGNYAHHWWVAGRFVESTEDAYLGADISTLSAKVPGFISQVAV